MPGRAPFLICALSLAICALVLPACRGSYDATFSVVSAQSAEPIPGAAIRLTYPQRRYFTPGDRTIVVDEDGQATTRVRRWPFMIYEVDQAGYMPYRLGVYRSLTEWEARALPVVQGSEPGEAPSIEPVVFPAVDLDDKGERVFEMPLAWDSRPTVRFNLPEGFEGVLLLTEQGDGPALPDAPTPRVFDVKPGARAVVPIPSWNQAEVPFVHYRFERAGEVLPAYSLRPGGEAARVIRDLGDALLVVVGPEQAHRAMQELLWNEDILEHRLVWHEDVFEEILVLLEDSGAPMTAEQICLALGHPYWFDAPRHSGGPRMNY